MLPRPDDRLKKLGAGKGTPKILGLVDIKIPDKEVHLMQPNETPPTGGGTCSCHSVCNCVPVSSCSCNLVCACDAVCSTNTCTCNPFTGCSTHTCTCQPECTTCSCQSTGCSCQTTICTCIPVTYHYPN